MRSRGDHRRIHRRHLAIAALVTGVLVVGWTIGPDRSNAESAGSDRVVVREPLSLGTLSGPNRSTRIVRGDFGIEVQVLDASGRVIAVFDDDPTLDRRLEALNAPNPRRGFAGVDDLRFEP